MKLPLAELLIPSISFLLASLLGKYIKLNNNISQAFSNISLGAIFSVLSIQFIPLIKDLTHAHHREKVLYGFLTGLVFMLVIQHLIKKKTGKKKINDTSYLIRCIPLFIAFIVDGLILGINLESYTSIFGILLAVILSIDNIFIGFSLGNTQKEFKISDSTGYLCIIMLVLAVPLGFLFGHNINNMFKNSSWFYFIISFGIFALIWELFQEQIPELYEQRNTQHHHKYINSFAFYFGFIGVLIAEWVVHPAK